MSTPRDPAQVARKLLQEGYTVPVDVRLLAQRQGMVVKEAPMEEEVSGAVVIRDTLRAALGVNSEHDPARRRFTLAYLVGYVLLHPEAMRPRFIHIVTAPIMIRPPEEPPLPPAQRAAVRFAVELLLPEPDMRDSARRLIQRGQADVEGRGLKAEAARLQVKPVLYLHRALELHLIGGVDGSITE